MKKVLRSPSYFQRIFRSMIIATFSVLLISIALLYVLFVRVTRNYLDSVNQHFLENTAASIRYQADLTTKNVLNAYTSAAGVTLMASTLPDAVDLLTNMREIDYFLAQDPLVHSVYIYSASSGEVFCFGSILSHSSLDNFFDTDFVERTLAGERTDPRAAPRTIPANRYGAEEQPTISRFIRTNSGDTILINVKPSALFGLLETDPVVFLNAPTSYLVCYAQNQIGYDSLYYPELSEAGSAALLNKLAEKKWESGFSASVNGTAFDFSLFQDTGSGFGIVSIIRSRDITDGFWLYQIFFVVIAAGGCLLALFTARRFSFSLYQPIGKLGRLMPADEEAPPPTPNQDEIEAIAHRFADTTSRLESLFEYKQSSSAALQLNLLKRQILYSQYTDEQFFEQCIQQELPYRPGDRFLLLYARWRPLRPGTGAQPQEQRLLCYALSNVFHELTDSELDSRDLPFDEDGTAFLCHTGQTGHLKLEPTLLENIRLTFRQYFGLALTFVISKPLAGPAAFCPTMKELMELAHYQYFHREGTILWVDSTDFTALNSDLPPLPDLSALESSLRVGELEPCQAMLQSYFDDLPHYTWEAARASINMLAGKIVAMLRHLQTSQPAFPEIDYHALFSRLTDAPSIAQVQECLNEQFEQITTCLSAPENDKSNLIADEVLNYLEQNYNDYNLSSKLIAQHYHVSVPYLNRIFKQKNGEPIASYLKNLRLEYAHTLLLDSNLSVEAIARRVGFENTKYFYTLFKEAYGASPSSYRTSGRLLAPPEE